MMYGKDKKMAMAKDKKGMAYGGMAKKPMAMAPGKKPMAAAKKGKK